MSGIAGKLVALAIRQVAKPLSLTIKAQVIHHPRFRKTCINIAQQLHSWDIRLRTSLLGEKGVKVRPLNDRKAIDVGATFLAEGFVFGVAGLIIVYETYKARKKSNERTEAIEDDIKVLQSEIEYLKKKLAQYNMVLDDYRVPNELSPKILKAIKEDVKDSEKNQAETLERLEEEYKKVKEANAIERK